MTFPHHFVSLDVKTHADHFAQAICQGLTAKEKALPIKHLFDANNDSRLFERVTQSGRCYMTQAEDTLLTRFAPRIIQQLKDNTALINLGSRSGKQTRRVIETLLQQQGGSPFAPIDVSGDFLSHSIQRLQHDFPDLRLFGVIADYPAGLNVLKEFLLQPRLLLWLGSDISHVEYAEAARLLRENMVAELKLGDHLLLGIDLKKPVEMLHAAYGCTDQDNAVRKVSLAVARRALRRINDELQADFVPENFDYYCHYNPVRGCMQIYLRSTCQQQLHIVCLGLTVEFAADEYILIHESYKYALDDIQMLVDATGLKLEQQWVDEETLYSLNLLVREDTAYQIQP